MSEPSAPGVLYTDYPALSEATPLASLWSYESREREDGRREDVDRLHAALCTRSLAGGLAVLRANVLGRLGPAAHFQAIERAAAQLLTARRGRVSIDETAARYGLSRQRFARRFDEAAGMPPKLFARIARFQGLVHALLSNDVSQWASIAPAAGFYDQAHMINEFRSFAGAPPTVFFRPHDPAIDPARVEIRGRPSEWLRQPQAGPLR